MNTRSKQNFDCDDTIRAGCVIASLLLKYKEVFVRRSSSGRGFHVVVDSKPDLLERWVIGDCFGRLHADMKRAKRGLPIGILFYYKNKKFTSRWVPVRAINLDGGVNRG
jgi:hypothetical protein